jgi:hypothetical protein
MKRPEQTVQLKLPWRITCKLACRAMITGQDFERLVESALLSYLGEPK